MIMALPNADLSGRTLINQVTKKYNDDTQEFTRQYEYVVLDDGLHKNFGLSSVIDENGNTESSWTYNWKDEAVSSQNALGQMRYDIVDISFVSNGIIPEVVVENQLGLVTTYNTSPESTRIEKITKKTKDNQFDASKSFIYDDNGNVVESIGYRGEVTKYTRDAQGRVIQMIEAFGTPSERVTETLWHESLNLPIEIREPTRISKYEYTPKGLVISSSVEPR